MGCFHKLKSLFCTDKRTIMTNNRVETIYNNNTKVSNFIYVKKRPFSIILGKTSGSSAHPIWLDEFGVCAFLSQEIAFPTHKSRFSLNLIENIHFWALGARYF